MPLFYFHVQFPGETVQDTEGLDLPDLKAARADALEAAREMWAEAIKAGRDLKAEAIEIADGDSRSLATVSVMEGLPKRLRVK